MLDNYLVMCSECGCESMREMKEFLRKITMTLHETINPFLTFFLIFFTPLNHSDEHHVSFTLKYAFATALHLLHFFILLHFKFFLQKRACAHKDSSKLQQQIKSVMHIILWTPSSTIISITIAHNHVPNSYVK